MPDIEDAEIFGLNSNANIIFNKNSSEYILNMKWIHEFYSGHEPLKYKYCFKKLI